jgi:hypothetical protein
MELGRCTSSWVQIALKGKEDFLSTAISGVAVRIEIHSQNMVSRI